jgi:O-antigen ligase
MLEALSANLAAPLSNRERLARLADGLAVAFAISLPWSTSATGVLAALWFLALLPTVEWTRLREILLTPAGGLPVAFTLLALLGVLWSQAPLGERFVSVVPYARLLAVPLLFYQFSRSPRGVWAIYGLLASCTVLLAASYLSYWLHGTAWAIPSKQPGVIVKDSIVQSGLFTICAFTLLGLAETWWPQARRAAAGLALLAIAFLGSLVMVSTSRTAWLVIAVLLVLFALRRSTWWAAAAVLAVGIVLGGAAWISSGYLRARITGIYTEIVDYRTKQTVTSSGERLEMWITAAKVISQAPVLGHGTGSLAATFKKASLGYVVADNPHNQTFAVGIQLGIVGIAMLYALWLSHFLLFRGAGWMAWFGMVVVVHSVVGSLTNSYLFDFTPGWAYAISVGVAGGIMLRRRTEAP